MNSLPLVVFLIDLPDGFYYKYKRDSTAVDLKKSLVTLNIRITKGAQT
jgi:hypothetical protein